MSETETGFEGWAILELMGHRRLGGRLSEATIASGAFIRIDIPHPNEAGIFTASRFYSPAAVYAITPTTEEIACAIARGAPEPVSRWDLRALTQQAGDSELSYAIETIVSELDETDDHDGDDPFGVMTRCAPADASGGRVTG
jgi:hypothetical protein